MQAASLGDQDADPAALDVTNRKPHGSASSSCKALDPLPAPMGPSISRLKEEKRQSEAIGAPCREAPAMACVEACASCACSTDMPQSFAKIAKE